MCMIWSWYLANDMQLYVIAIILLILSTRFAICVQKFVPLFNDLFADSSNFPSFPYV